MEPPNAHKSSSRLLQQLRLGKARLVANNPQYELFLESTGFAGLEHVMGVADIARTVLSYLTSAVPSEDLVHLQSGFLPLTVNTRTAYVAPEYSWKAIQVVPRCNRLWYKQSKDWFTSISIRLYEKQASRTFGTTDILRPIDQEVLMSLLQRFQPVVKELRLVGKQLQEQHNSGNALCCDLVIPWNIIADSKQLKKVIVAGRLSTTCKQAEYARSVAKVVLTDAGLKREIDSLSLMGCSLHELTNFLLSIGGQLRSFTLAAPQGLDPELLVGTLKLLSNLETLNADFFGTMVAPVHPIIAHLNHLNALRWSGASLQELPYELFSMANLRTLEFPKNQLGVLTVELLFQMKHLRLLDLSVNNILQIPDYVGNLEQLEELNLSFNRLSEVPTAICSLKKLLTLRLERNRLTCLPNSIGELQSLKNLHCDNNRIMRLPDSLGELHELQLLAVQRNGLLSIPESLCKLQELKVLRVSDNSISALPQEIGMLQALTELDVSGNRLTHLPESITGITTLESLDISRNNFDNLQIDFSQLTNVKTLVLESKGSG